MICTLPYEEPEHHTRPPYTGGIAPPELEEVPQEEVDIDISEGGVATLKCFATGFPPPTITWKRHGIEVSQLKFRRIKYFDARCFFLAQYKSRPIRPYFLRRFTNCSGT